MEGLEKQCFQIISAVGMARSSYIEAIQEAKKANFERAREMIEEGDKSFLQGHEAHAKMIQQEAGGEKVETGLLDTKGSPGRGGRRLTDPGPCGRPADECGKL